VNIFIRMLLFVALGGIIESFIILPMYGMYLNKHCKKECLNCQHWECDKWHSIENINNRKNRGL